MMTSSDLLADAFGRIREVVHEVADGLTPDQLVHRVDGRGNSIAWLLWHLTRVQDDHVSEVAGAEQAWIAGGWSDRFGLSLPAMSIGYGHTSEQVDAVRVDDPALLVGYHDAVYERTVTFVRGIAEPDLRRIVDEAWDPPVTLAVRLISVISDDLQHAGQAAFVRGLVTGTRAES
jgi:uncharacterized damage-inducible protein DinB